MRNLVPVWSKLTTFDETYLTWSSSSFLLENEALVTLYDCVFFHYHTVHFSIKKAFVYDCSNEAKLFYIFYFFIIYLYYI